MGKTRPAKRHPLFSRGLRVWDAAEYVGLSKSRLNTLRSLGNGPLYTKVGHSIFYDVHDLNAWIRRRRKKFKSTADYVTSR